MLLIVFQQQDTHTHTYSHTYTETLCVGAAIVIMDYCTGQAISHCVYVMWRENRCVFSICVAQKFNAQDKQLAWTSQRVPVGARECQGVPGSARVPESPWKLSQCQWLPLRLLLGWAAANVNCNALCSLRRLCSGSSCCCCCCCQSMHACKTRTSAGWLRGMLERSRGRGVATTFFRTVVFALCGKFTAWHIKQASGDMIGFMSACLA